MRAAVRVSWGKQAEDEVQLGGGGGGRRGTRIVSVSSRVGRQLSCSLVVCLNPLLA